MSTAESSTAAATNQSISTGRSTSRSPDRSQPGDIPLPPHHLYAQLEPDYEAIADALKSAASKQSGAELQDTVDEALLQRFEGMHLRLKKRPPESIVVGSASKPSLQTPDGSGAERDGESEVQRKPALAEDLDGDKKRGHDSDTGPQTSLETGRAEEELEKVHEVDNDDDVEPYELAPVAVLPDELLAEVLKFVIVGNGGVTDVLNFGLSTRRWFVISRQESVWKELCLFAYRHHRINLGTESAKRLEDEQLTIYGGSWRKMYKLRPRVRFDGVYIARCHYYRQGLAENQWYNPLCLVTYYRYLRFFPNGTCLKVLSNDEPAMVVPQLDVGRNGGANLLSEADQQHLKVIKGGLFRGRFSLLLSGATDVHQLQIKLRSREQWQRIFSLELDLKPSLRGKWNRLVWLDYFSRKLLTITAPTTGNVGRSRRQNKRTNNGPAAEDSVFFADDVDFALTEDLIEEEENETRYDLAQMRNFVFSRVKSFRW